MGSRNLLTILIVIFLAVLLYNGLYFTGVLGGFGSSQGIEPLAQDPRFDLPGLDRPGVPGSPGAQRPMASGGPTVQTAAHRAALDPADLTIGTNWSRNPFLTPREAWALANYHPMYVTDPLEIPDGLYLSAIVIDSSGRKVAIINGEIVAVGSKVAGMEVVEMTNDAVVFRVNGNRHVLRMADASIGLTARSNTGRY